MRIAYLHASRFGNGAKVADEFSKLSADRGVVVEVHHIREVRPAELPPADLYVFSSPGRFGKPIGSMRRFLPRVRLPAGTRYALLTTELMPGPDKSGHVLSREEVVERQRVRRTMEELLDGNGLVRVAEDAILVTAVRGPLESGWQRRVEDFVAEIAGSSLAPGS